jgi:hypothetical protein
MGNIKRLYCGLQMPLMPELVDAYPIPTEGSLRAEAFRACEKIVLGGDEFAGTQEADPLALNFESKACGWIGWKESKRERKKRDAWICRQAWLYWEEPGGKKRSRYIPKSKLAAVQESVYELRRTIGETLEILGKK